MRCSKALEKCVPQTRSNILSASQNALQPTHLTLTVRDEAKLMDQFHFLTTPFLPNKYKCLHSYSMIRGRGMVMVKDGNVEEHHNVLTEDHNGMHNFITVQMRNVWVNTTT